MGTEVGILALYGLVVVATILLQVLMALPQLGLPYLSSARDEGRPLSGGAARCARALENSVVAMALFAPAVLVLQVTGATTGATLLAAQIFLIARIVYVPIYIVGIPYLRTGVWMAGFLATAYLYLMAL